MLATNRSIVTSAVDFLGISMSSHMRGKDALDVVWYSCGELDPNLTLVAINSSTRD